MLSAPSAKKDTSIQADKHDVALHMDDMEANQHSLTCMMSDGCQA